MQNIKPFHTVDAPAGSGKTYQAIQWAMTQAAVRQRKTAIIFKSIDLLKQAQKDACALDQKSKLAVPINGIHSYMFEQFGTTMSVAPRLMQLGIPGGRWGKRFHFTGFPARTFDQKPRGGTGMSYLVQVSLIVVVDVPIDAANSVIGLCQTNSNNSSRV